jgi:hypothetical protein
MTTNFQYIITKTIKRIRHQIEFLFCFSFLILYSCTSPIDINTDSSDSVIAIYGAITDEVKHQEIRLSSSSPYFQNKPNFPVSGATVIIESSDNKRYELIEVETIPGLYMSTSQWAVTPGITYNLHVTVDFDKNGNAESYNASTYIAAKMELDSVKLAPMNIMGHKNYALNTYGQETPGHDYYLFKYILNNTPITTKISEYITYDDTGINGQYLDGLTIDYFDHIDNWESDSDDQRKHSTYLKPEDILIVEISKIPAGYYDFINQCQKEMRGENPLFGGPASNIITNISGGGVGFFCGYCISQSSAVVPSF